MSLLAVKHLLIIFNILLPVGVSVTLLGTLFYFCIYPAAHKKAPILLVKNWLRPGYTPGLQVTCRSLSWCPADDFLVFTVDAVPAEPDMHPDLKLR